MDKNKICEAMYALPGGVIVKRRKSLTTPITLMLVGVAMVVLNNLYRDSLTVNLSSALVFAGGVTALCGLILASARAFGSSGVPFYRQGRSYLRYEELYFEHDDRSDVLQCVDCGDVERLLSMGHATVPVVAVALYRTSDNRFAAMQAFEYADLEYRPLTELKFVGA